MSIQIGINNIADLAPDLSEEERIAILETPEFSRFLEDSGKIIQRALSDGYDYIRDYAIGGEQPMYVLFLPLYKLTDDLQRFGRSECRKTRVYILRRALDE